MDDDVNGLCILVVVVVDGLLLGWCLIVKGLWFVDGVVVVV